MKQVSNKPVISEYGSVDPAPAEASSNIPHLKKILLDEDTAMFKRMRALRVEKSCWTTVHRCPLSGFAAKSALLRHELAYVLGQIQDVAALPTLVGRLQDPDEHLMVRHEAAEALGAIGDPSIEPVLQMFVRGPSPEVAESCLVALDLLTFCNDERHLAT